MCDGKKYGIVGILAAELLGSCSRAISEGAGRTPGIVGQNFDIAETKSRKTGAQGLGYGFLAGKKAGGNFFTPSFGRLFQAFAFARRVDSLQKPFTGDGMRNAADLAQVQSQPQDYKPSLLSNDLQQKYGFVFNIIAQSGGFGELSL